MNSTPMMQIVLDTVLFFGLGSDDIVQPDEAVNQLEAIATELRKLPQGELEEFLRFVDAVAKAEEKDGQDSDRIEFMRQMGENLGLSE